MFSCSFNDIKKSVGRQLYQYVRHFLFCFTYGNFYKRKHFLKLIYWFYFIIFQRCEWNSKVLHQFLQWWKCLQRYFSVEQTEKNQFFKWFFSASLTFDRYEQEEIHKYLFCLYIFFLVLQEFWGFFPSLTLRLSRLFRLKINQL